MEWIRIFSTPAEARQRLLESKPQLVIVRGKRICLVLRNNTLRAIDDRCSHNGESLSKGMVNYLGEVVCPWHGHRFDLATGRESSERSADLATYPIREETDGVYLGF